MKTTQDNKIFVVHGRNEKIKRSMFSFLRSLYLEPIEWNKAKSFTGKATPYVGDILNSAFAVAKAVVILLTPDDEARLNQQYLKDDDSNYERVLTGQARPNVIFEAGMAFGYNPDKTVIVEFGSLRPFSDIAGRHTIHMNNEIQSRLNLINALSSCDIDIDIINNTDWQTEGNFSL